jgi:glutamate 5-kinase
VRTLVIKIGSAVLAPEGALEAPAVQALADQIGALRRAGSVQRVVVVSSGAVASGFALLGHKRPPRAIAHKQAAAAVGQPRLMSAWIDALARHGLLGAQALYTADDLAQRERSLNSRRTLADLLDRGAVPIVNENDTTSFAEIKLGDNDRLSALTADLVDADLLLILSTARGLYEHGDPRRVIPAVRPGAQAGAHVQAGTSGVGTGGMATKLHAAALCARWGIPTIIAGGRDERVIQRALAGEPVGTLFVPRQQRAGARKRWLSAAATRCAILIDAGAARAIEQRGASLLPRGIVGVRGVFSRHATVELREAGDTPKAPGRLVARGLAGYSSDELSRIAGARASEISARLGYCDQEEAVHRDHLELAAESE